MTVSEMNTIQAEWLKLDSSAPKPEQQRVCELFAKLPRRHLNVSVDKSVAGMTVDGAPMISSPIPLNDAKEYAKRFHARTDIAWCGELGEWVSV